VPDPAHPGDGTFVATVILVRDGHPDLALSLVQADLVFEGVVTNVRYKSSQPASPDDGAMPHTFVTYKVTTVLKPQQGLPAELGGQVTLRFLGGESETNGRVLDVKEYPMFDVGDHDLLVVERNTRKSCPLVACAEGRYRFFDGLTYDDDGAEIEALPGGA